MDDNQKRYDMITFTYMLQNVRDIMADTKSQDLQRECHNIFSTAEVIINNMTHPGSFDPDMLKHLLVIYYEKYATIKKLYDDEKGHKTFGPCKRIYSTSAFMNVVLDMYGALCASYDAEFLHAGVCFVCNAMISMDELKELSELNANAFCAELNKYYDEYDRIIDILAKKEEQT